MNSNLTANNQINTINTMNTNLSNLAIQNMQQGIPQNIQQGMSQNMQQGIPQNMQQGMSQNIQQGMSQNIQQGMSQNIQQGIPQNMQQNLTKSNFTTQINSLNLPTQVLPNGMYNGMQNYNQYGQIMQNGNQIGQNIQQNGNQIGQNIRQYQGMQNGMQNNMQGMYIGQGIQSIPQNGQSIPKINGNVLFFSNCCRLSTVLLSLLTNEGLINFFQLICTDNNPSTNGLIKTTPMLFFGKLGKNYEGVEALQWVQGIKQHKMNIMLTKVNNVNQQQLQMMNNNLNPSTSQVLNYSASEMEGLSDIFAYLMTDEAIPHSYSGYKNDQTIFTAPQEKGKNAKIDHDQQKKYHDELLRQRREQDKVHIQHLDNIHQNIKNIVK
jgi:hypothetical protein